MRTLQLVLKKKWFDMIADGIKHEEYRDINKYWCRRLYECYTDAPGHYGQCQTLNKETCQYEFNCPCHECDVSELKKFDGVMFYLGYAKNRPRMYVPIERITIGTGKPEWGAEPGKKYFVIKLKED